MIINTNVEAINFNGNPVNKLIYNGVEVWPKTTPTPDYTEVKYIKGVNIADYTADKQYFDTGIIIPNSGTSVMNLDCFTLLTHGEFFVGHCGDNFEDGRSDVSNRHIRVFAYNMRQFYFDVGTGRTSRTNNYVPNNWWQFIATIDMDNKSFNCRCVAAGTSPVQNFTMSSTFGIYPNLVPIYISLRDMKFHHLYIVINGTIVFDGTAAIDSDSIPCIYDSVSNRLIYAKGSMSGSRYLAYEN